MCIIDAEVHVSTGVNFRKPRCGIVLQQRVSRLEFIAHPVNNITPRVDISVADESTTGTNMHSDRQVFRYQGPTVAAFLLRLATYVKSAIHDRNLSLRGLQTILHRCDHASTPP